MPCNAARSGFAAQPRIDQKHRSSSGGPGAPGSKPGDAIDQTSQQPMNSGLLVLSVLLFMAGVTLISLG